MAEYLLPCPCGQKIRVAGAQAGGQVSCACGQKLAVPTLRGLRELEVAPAEAAGRKGPAWSPLQGAVFSAALLAAGLGATIALYHVWQYVRVHELAVDRSDEVIAFDAEHIEKLSAEEILHHWREMEAEGLGERRPPYWVRAKSAIESYLHWIKIGGVLCAGGLAVAVVTLFVARRS